MPSYQTMVHLAFVDERMNLANHWAWPEDMPLPRVGDAVTIPTAERIPGSLTATRLVRRVVFEPYGGDQSAEPFIHIYLSTTPA